jgi:hypothetical protein
LQFLFRDAERLLPVWHEGRLQLARWGNRRGESRALPLTGWARLETWEGGGLGRWRPVEVFVPATLGCDEAGLERVYPLIEPASHLLCGDDPVRLDAGADWRADLRGGRWPLQGILRPRAPTGGRRRHRFGCPAL